MSDQKQLSQAVDRVVDGLNKGFRYDGSGGGMDTPHAYIEQALDVILTTDLAGNLQGGFVTVSLGGPNIYVDFGTATVEGHWANKSCRKSFDTTTAQELWGAVEEMRITH